MEARSTPGWVQPLTYGIAGAFLAVVGIALGAAATPTAEPAEADPVVTPTSAVDTAEPFVAVGEALLANTALVPISIELDGGDIEVGYELVPLGGDQVTAAPERWELKAAGVTYEARTSSQTADRVRFEDVAATPEELIVTQWRFQTSLRYPLDLPRTGSIFLDEGTELFVQRLLEQSTGTIIQFGIDTASRIPSYGSDDFPAGPIIAGRGEGWLVGDWVNLEALNPGAGFGAAQLVWVDGPVPDVLELEVVSGQWAPRVERIPIQLPGGQG